MGEVGSFPRQAARTLRYTLGLPRSFVIPSGADRVLFLRSKSGTDRANCLWSLDLDSMSERLVADPRRILGGDDEELSAEERARRERSREAAAGIVSFSVDESGETVVFTLSGRLWTVPATGGEVTELEIQRPALDPRIDPTGTRVAYVSRRALRVVELDSGADGALLEPDGADVTWGLAEHVAAEEMGRDRGFWWSPDGDRLLVARVDQSPVQRWHIADPANPDRPAHEMAFPAAGTPNADVTLWFVDLEGRRAEVEWDHDSFEYLTAVSWNRHGPPVIQVMSRDQRRALVLSVAEDASTEYLRADEESPWIELRPGTPAMLPGGRLLHALDDLAADTRHLAIDGEPLTPPGLQVRTVVSAGEAGIFFTGATEDATQAHLYRWRDGRIDEIANEPGIHAAVVSGDLAVVTSRTLETTEVRTRVLRNGEPLGEIASHAETPVLVPRPRLRPAGRRRLNTALLLPQHDRGESLAVIMDPYGGPHSQRVVSALGAYYTAQWIADQGFAVVVADGRGSPGRGPQWEKSIAGDLATHALDDQVDALHALAEDHPELDLSRVGIRGASFGGFLAALAVLRRPDVFHAAVATASVTDWRLYDTFYTERYLGLPHESPEAYSRSSLLDDAPKLERPLLLVHGMADDNVVVAHTLRLSAALLAAGRPHQVLPLSGITHMTAPDEVVAENLLTMEVDFFRTHLG